MTSNFINMSRDVQGIISIKEYGKYEKERGAKSEL